MGKKEIEEIAIMKIYKDFPDFKDVVPYIEEKVLSVPEGEFKKLKMKSVKGKKVWIAIFKKIFKSEDGRKIKKIIRATISSDGEIIKISESH